MPTSNYQWVYAPKKPAPPKVPEALKRKVETEANALIETVLRPQHIQPPPEDPQFNYIVDLSTKWYRSYFYFCSRYAVSGPNAIVAILRRQVCSPGIHWRRLFQPVGHATHTGQWMEIYPDLSLDECLAAVRDDPWFHP